MAGKEYPLSIVIRTVDKSTQALRAVTAKFAKLGEKMDKIGKKAQKIGKNLTTSLTLPIVAVGAAGVKAMADFETGMASVSTLIDTNVESMDNMGKKVLEISRRTPVAIDELTSALFDLRSGGTSAGDAMDRLERSAQLGVAGLGTTAQAAKLATGAINAWGLEGEEANKIFNTIFLTTKNGITTIAGLEQGFGAVAKKMADANIEVDDYLASVAALTTTTVKASEAHTQMKAAVDGLEKGGKKTGKVFRKLGVKDFKTLVERTGSVTEAFRAVKEAVGDQSGALKDLIGSSEGVAAVNALAGAQGDRQISTLSEMRKETEGLTDAQVAFNKQNATTASKLKRAKNSIESAAISLGKVLVPVVEKLTEKLIAASDWWESLDDGTKETIATIAGLVATLGPAIMLFGKLSSTMGMVAKAFKVMDTVAKANIIVASLMAIAWAAKEIYDNWEDFEDFFKLLWDGVKFIFKSSWDYISGIIEKVIRGANRVKNAVLKAASYLPGGGGIGKGLDMRKILERQGVKGLPPSTPALGASILGAPALGRQPPRRIATASGGSSRIEIDIKGAPQGTRIKTKSDERQLDVTMGSNLAGAL